MSGLKLATIFVGFCASSINGYCCDTPLNPEWDKAIIEIIKKDNDTTYTNFGTGFLVGTYEPECQFMLVSNKHILGKRDDLYFRVNLKDTTLKKVDTIYLNLDDTINAIVVYPKDAELDLAAYRLCKRDTNWDVKWFPKSKFKAITDIKRGTEVYYLGFPISISIESRSIPVYRSGVIALDQKYIGEDYLIDGMVIQGSSGSPVFDCTGNLVGVIYSHLNYYSNDPVVWDVLAKDIRIEASLRLNSGFGRIIPVDLVIDFIQEIIPKWKSK